MAQDNKQNAKGRRAYLNDFAMNAEGKYVYTGKHVAWGCPRRPALLGLWLPCGGMLAAAVCAGCLPDSGATGAVWALLPYVLALVGAVTCAYALGRLTLAGDPVRQYVFRETAEALPGRCRITQLFSGVAMAGGLINLALPGFSGSRLQGLLLVLLEGLILLLTECLRRRLAALRWSRS